MARLNPWERNSSSAQFIAALTAIPDDALITFQIPDDQNPNQGFFRKITGANFKEHISGATLTQAAVYLIVKEIIEGTTGVITVTDDDAGNDITIDIADAILTKINNAVKPAQSYFFVANAITTGDFDNTVQNDEPAFLFLSGSTPVGTLNTALTDAQVASVTHLKITRWLNTTQNYTAIENTAYIQNRQLQLEELRSQGGVIFLHNTTLHMNEGKATPDPDVYYKFTITATGNLYANDVFTFTGSLEKVGSPANGADYYTFSESLLERNDLDARHLTHLRDVFSRAIANPTKYLTLDPNGLGESNPPVSSAERTKWNTAATEAGTAVQPDDLYKVEDYYQFLGDATDVTNSFPWFNFYAGTTKYTHDQFHAVPSDLEVASWTKLEFSKQVNITGNTINPEQSQNQRDNTANFAQLLTGTHDIWIWGETEQEQGFLSDRHIKIEDASISLSAGIYTATFTAGSAKKTGSPGIGFNRFSFVEPSAQHVDYHNIVNRDEMLKPYTKIQDLFDENTFWTFAWTSASQVSQSGKNDNPAVGFYAGSTNVYTSNTALTQEKADTITEIQITIYQAETPREGNAFGGYWNKDIRTRLEALRTKGGLLIFMGANALTTDHNYQFKITPGGGAAVANNVIKLGVHSARVQGSPRNLDDFFMVSEVLQKPIKIGSHLIEFPYLFFTNDKLSKADAAHILAMKADLTTGYIPQADLLAGVGGGGNTRLGGFTTALALNNTLKDTGINIPNADLSSTSDKVIEFMFTIDSAAGTDKDFASERISARLFNSSVTRAAIGTTISASNAIAIFYDPTGESRNRQIAFGLTTAGDLTAAQLSGGPSSIVGLEVWSS